MRLHNEQSMQYVHHMTREPCCGPTTWVSEDSHSLRTLLAKKSPERSRRKVISSHAVQSVQLSIGYSYNCLPWYYKKKVVFQIKELRKRLEYLIRDSQFGMTGRILPSTIPPQLRSSCRWDAVHSKKNMRIVCSEETNNQFDKSIALSQCMRPAEDKGKENNAVLANINKKRASILRVITNRRLNKGKQGDMSQQWSVRTKQQNQVPLPSSSYSTNTKTAASSWYVRPSHTNGKWKEPTYCSMEMISFDKETECFHRTEIAYPFQPPIIGSPSFSSDTKCGNNRTDDKGDIKIVNRRLAKKVQIRSASVNNIFKHSLIWD
ncbi:hypothetical protein IV203_000101 [Nitzschia inconspicua]|uniref:Uncharacterized protein n=1 Tax=Nitzschia inconspicua TaxID=303405 RepID=A0A9K3L4C8_9STRA|nr:hypothetical protein IV203_000101 [Nitzschia inconspicua]